MNPKNPQSKEEIVVHMSAKGLSQYDVYLTISQTFPREKFSELVNRISLALTQDTETEPSDSIIRYSIVKKSFSEEGIEISSRFPSSLPSSLGNAFGVQNPVSLHSPPIASTLGQRKLPASTPYPKKQLKTEIKSLDSESKSNKMSEMQSVPILIDLESPTYATTDFGMSSSGEIRAPFNSDDSHHDIIEELKPELDENLSLSELLHRDRLAKEKQASEDSKSQKSSVDKKQVKKEQGRSYKEDEAMRVFNPAKYTLLHQKAQSDKSNSQSDGGMFKAEIVISDNEWVFEEACFSPVEQSQDLKGHRHSPELDGLKRKQNFKKKTEAKPIVHNSTNENSPNSLDEDDDCRIECTDPRQDEFMGKFLRTPKTILKPVQKLSGQFDRPERGSIIIE